MLLMPLSYSSYCCVVAVFLFWYCCLCVYFPHHKCLLPPMFSQAWILFVLVFMKALITHTTLETQERDCQWNHLFIMPMKNRRWMIGTKIPVFPILSTMEQVWKWNWWIWCKVIPERPESNSTPKTSHNHNGRFRVDCTQRMGKQIVVYHSLCVHLFFIVIKPPPPNLFICLSLTFQMFELRYLP